MKKILSCLILLFLLSDIASGFSEIALNDVERPDGAILFIVDGLGSSYYFPEFTPYALDGSELPKARTENLTSGSRILDTRTPHPVTGIAHSVIVTGFSDANEEMVSYPDATIYDITRHNGFVNLAVMETGDFPGMREEQDIIMFAENNSIDEPKISIQATKAPSGIYELMYEWRMKLPSYLDRKSGVKRYSAYNKWSIDAANAVAISMINDHPSQKFLLTVNIGAIDSGGHNLGVDNYISLIESLDSDFYPLYRTASENNIALFFTADHGMSFAAKNAKRGGHISDKYSSRQESLRIPFVVFSPNANPGVIEGVFGQEDIAPTLLSILDLPNNLQYADSKPVNLKNYASIFIRSHNEYDVSLWNNGKKIAEHSGAELGFTGLQLNMSYTLKAKGKEGVYEEHLFLDSDKQFVLSKPESGIIDRKTLAIILILIVVASGLIIIKRMFDNK